MRRLTLIAAILACLLPAAHAGTGGFAFRLPREDGSGWIEPGGFDSPAVFLFWSADCPPCLVELAGLGALRSAFPNVRFVAVNLDGREAARRMRSRIDLPDGVLRARAPQNPRDLLARLGNAEGALPFSAIYDGNGNLCAAVRGTLTPHILSVTFSRCGDTPSATAALRNR